MTVDQGMRVGLQPPDSRRYSRLRPLQTVRTRDHHATFVFHPDDQPALTRLAGKLRRRLPCSPACTHFGGHGGLKGTIRSVQAHLAGDGHPGNAQRRWFVYRTDVKSYCSSIDRHILHGKVAAHIRDRDCLNLLWQYLTLSVETGGTFRDAPAGLRPSGAPSPVLAAFYLHDLDQDLCRQRGIFYRRYMDDLIIIAPGRWASRCAIATVQRHFAALGQGLLARGIDFLGYLITQTGVRLSPESLRHHHERPAGFMSSVNPVSDVLRGHLQAGKP